MKNAGTESHLEWLDRMYNNRQMVPDHALHFMRWAKDSESVRKRLPCQLDLTYGDQPGETLDIFPSEGINSDHKAPVLVFIHGGYWRGLDKSDHSFLAPHFTQAGACVVVLNYALCPTVSIPQIVRQMVNALAWTWRHIADFGGDPQRITVAGHSAGGHLATMMLTTDWPAHAPDLPSDLLVNALSISGLYDLDPVHRTPFLKDLNLTSEQVRQASPVLLPPPSKATLYSVAGGDESEEFLRQNQLIRQTWGNAAVPICESLAGLNHFSILEALVEPSHRLGHLALELLGLAKAPSRCS